MAGTPFHTALRPILSSCAFHFAGRCVTVAWARPATPDPIPFLCLEIASSIRFLWPPTDVLNARSKRIGSGLPFALLTARRAGHAPHTTTGLWAALNRLGAIFVMWHPPPAFRRSRRRDAPSGVRAFALPPPINRRLPTRCPPARGTGFGRF